jgi:hypothetical protein
VSYFTLRIIIVLMETIRALYISAHSDLRGPRQEFALNLSAKRRLCNTVGKRFIDGTTRSCVVSTARSRATAMTNLARSNHSLVLCFVDLFIGPAPDGRLVIRRRQPNCAPDHGHLMAIKPSNYQSYCFTSHSASVPTRPATFRLAISFAFSSALSARTTRHAALLGRRLRLVMTAAPDDPARPAPLPYRLLPSSLRQARQASWQQARQRAPERPRLVKTREIAVHCRRPDADSGKAVQRANARGRADSRQTRF